MLESDDPVTPAAHAPDDLRMNRTLTAIAAISVLALAGCSSSSTPDTSGKTSAAQTAPPATASAALTATAAFQQIAKDIPTAKLTVTVTEANDGNHLLGRPGQYTSAIKFADSRIKGPDVSGYKVGDVELGGAIEVFPTAAGAKARGEYIQKVTASIPALTEYDYPHGTALIRVSHYLTPAQAADYDKAGAKLG